MDRGQELEYFKSSINLSEYSASEYGYKIDRLQSSKNSVVMYGDNHDKIVVARGDTGHYIYFSVRDDRDNGSIIDFIQNRSNQNLGEIRKMLRQWTGDSSTIRTIPEHLFQRKIETTTKDRLGAIQSISKMQPASTHSYLESRNIHPGTLQNHRFINTIFTDKYHNAVFPHKDLLGICGYEIKNKKFTGFCKGGMKALWVSNVFKQDQEMIITETGIDALSHYELKQNSQSRYLSMGGAWSEEASAILTKAAERFNGHTIRLAFDNDVAGDELLEKARYLLSRLDKNIIEDRPINRGHDWNDELKQKR